MNKYLLHYANPLQWQRYALVCLLGFVLGVGVTCSRSVLPIGQTTAETSVTQAEVQTEAQPVAPTATLAGAPPVEAAGAAPPVVASLPDAPVLNELAVFSDALANSWQNWSWNTGVDLANRTLSHTGDSTMAVSYSAAWAGFYLHTDQLIASRDYDLIRFWVNGGNEGNQRFRVVLADEGNAFLGESSEVSAQAGAWTLVEIPISVLGAPTKISGIGWQDTLGSAQPTFYIDDLAFVDLDLPPTPTPAPIAGPALTVDVNAGRHAINPDIYGINYASEALAQELRLPVRRWGGNATTRYNWQNDTANRASDWFFENIPENTANPDALPAGSAADLFVEQDQRTGAKTILTMPMIGWTPKSRERTCGFSVAKYGTQQYTDSWQPDCGNGVDSSGNNLVNNDPTDTSMAIDPSFNQAWIQHLIGQFGTAAEGGVAFYSLDNEPMLWHITHRDVHPTLVGYDELRDRTYLYASAIKQADPTAQTLGPVLWGWTDYSYSALDSEGGGTWWNKAPDRKAHGDMPLVAWYLQEMQRYEQEHGVRILDYLDLHYYPQGSNVALGGVGDSATRALRLRSTRSLWDPSYKDESWIDEPVQLIPRMHDWVDQYYPGTKLSLTEYNWGALDHLNGALAQADILGIFGREQLDLATLWAPLKDDDPFAFAFRLYRNYDGNGGSFGDTSLEAQSSDQEKIAIYAAQRSGDGAITLMVINKSADTFASPITLAGVESPKTAQLFRYSGDDLLAIQQLDDQPLNNGSLAGSFPGNSITLIILP